MESLWVRMWIDSRFKVRRTVVAMALHAKKVRHKLNCVPRLYSEYSAASYPNAQTDTNGMQETNHYHLRSSSTF